MLLLSALAEGKTDVLNLLHSDDITYMLGALTALGIPYEYDQDGKKVTVNGCGGKIPSEGAELFLGNAGTAMRPLTAALCVGNGKYVSKRQWVFEVARRMHVPYLPDRTFPRSGSSSMALRE